jgi:hypothetical protein
MTKSVFKEFLLASLAKKGGEVVQISGFARNLNHFPLFSHKQSASANRCLPFRIS